MDAQLIIYPHIAFKIYGKLEISFKSDSSILVALKMKAHPRGKSVFPLFSDLNDAWN